MGCCCWSTITSQGSTFAQEPVFNCRHYINLYASFEIAWNLQSFKIEIISCNDYFEYFGFLL